MSGADRVITFESSPGSVTLDTQHAVNNDHFPLAIVDAISRARNTGKQKYIPLIIRRMNIIYFGVCFHSPYITYQSRIYVSEFCGF